MNPTEKLSHHLPETPADLPAGVRWFSWLLFLRHPLVIEVPEIQAVLQWSRKHWWRLALLEAAVILTLTMPALMRGRSWIYDLAAIALPQVLLWAVAMSAAYSLVGYRVNLQTMRCYLPQMRRSQRRKMHWSLRVVFLCLIGLLGVASGYGFASLFGSQAGVQLSWMAGELLAYWSDTFSSGFIYTFLMAVVLVVVPETIARMRLRESELQTRTLRAEAEAQRLARHQAESELRLLQAQVQPHFLYNTLANVRYLIQKNSPDALRMTDALIDYLRTAVPDMRADRVTLGLEVEHVQHYLTIMEVRMQGRLRFHVDVAEQWRARMVPPLVLLTLVENAVKHGVARAVDGGEIALRAYASPSIDAEGEPDLVVEVIDSGAGGEGTDAGALTPGTGTGLSNVRERLRLLAGERATLELIEREEGGTIARMVLPMLGEPAGQAVASVPNQPGSVALNAR
jgi:hypothetical protein